MKAQIDIYFELFISLVTIGIVAFILLLFANALPVGEGKTLLTYITNTSLVFIDFFFFIIALAMCIYDLYESHQNPSKAKAIVNIFGLFLLGFIDFSFRGLLTGSLSFLNLSTNLTKAFTFFTSGTAVFLFALFMVISIVLNVSSHG